MLEINEYKSFVVFVSVCSHSNTAAMKISSLYGTFLIIGHLILEQINIKSKTLLKLHLKKKYI